MILGEADLKPSGQFVSETDRLRGVGGRRAVMQFKLQSDVVKYHKPGFDPHGKRCVPMTYFRFSSEDTPVFNGLVTNCSEDGLVFRSQHPLKPGQTVFIRIDPDQMIPIGGQCMEGNLKSMCLAEICRCYRNQDSISGQYTARAKYLNP